MLGWIGIVLGGLLSLFSGGCSLYLLTDYRGGQGLRLDPNNWEIISVIGGIPFAIGLAIVLLALLFGRRPSNSGSGNEKGGQR